MILPQTADIWICSTTQDTFGGAVNVYAYSFTVPCQIGTAKEPIRDYDGRKGSPSTYKMFMPVGYVVDTTMRVKNGGRVFNIIELCDHKVGSISDHVELTLAINESPDTTTSQQVDQ